MLGYVGKATVAMLLLILLAGCIGEEKKENVLEKLKGLEKDIKEMERSLNNSSGEMADERSGAEGASEEELEGGEGSTEGEWKQDKLPERVEWVKERYVKLDQLLHFDDLKLTIVVDGWDVKANYSHLVLRFENRDSKDISFKVERAEAELFGLTVKGEEGKAFTVEGDSEREVRLAFPVNGNYVESVLINMSYRKELEEKRAIEGYIRLKIELGRVMLERPMVYIYIPKQCEEEPWGEDVVNYYKERGVEIYKAEKVFLSSAVCMACHVCPKGYLWRVYVEGNGDALLEDGWQRE